MIATGLALQLPPEISMWIHLLLGSFLIVVPVVLTVSALVSKLRSGQYVPGDSTYRRGDRGSANKTEHKDSGSQEAHIRPEGRIMIHTKRIYEKVENSDGERILVDRVWPRGVSKEKASLSGWRKDLAPSGVLRKGFGHDPSLWDEFLEHYRKELEEAGKLDDLRDLSVRARDHDITFIFAARDTEHNNARALAAFVSELE